MYWPILWLKSSHDSRSAPAVLLSWQILTTLSIPVQDWFCLTVHPNHHTLLSFSCFVRFCWRLKTWFKYSLIQYSIDYVILKNDAESICWGNCFGVIYLLICIEVGSVEKDPPALKLESLSDDFYSRNACPSPTENSTILPSTKTLLLFNNLFRLTTTKT